MSASENQMPPPAPPGPLKVDRSDLSIEELPRVKCAGDGCENHATHFIMLDLRNAGEKCQLGGPYCLLCAQVVWSRIADALPVPPVQKDDVPF